MARLEIDNVRIALGSGDRQFVLDPVNLDIASGEFIVCVGPSGSGKSTIMRCVAGLEQIARGEIRLGDKRIDQLSPADRGIAMVFQNYALYPHMTVLDNMAFSLKMSGVGKDERERLAMDAARKLQMEHLVARKPAELSGGQRQRVAIGRAIVRNPQAFLFDEPLSNLDAGLRSHMRMEISKLHRDLGVTSMYVTHDQIEAMTLADRLVLFSTKGIEQIGTPAELFDSPRNQYVAEFLGTPSINILQAGLKSDCLEFPGGARLELQSAPKYAGSVSIGVRPRKIRLADQGLLKGKVQMEERLGDETLVYVQLEGQERTSCVVCRGRVPELGDSVSLDFSAADIYLFDALVETLALPAVSNFSS